MNYNKSQPNVISESVISHFSKDLTALELTGNWSIKLSSFKNGWWWLGGGKWGTSKQLAIICLNDQSVSCFLGEGCERCSQRVIGGWSWFGFSRDIHFCRRSGAWSRLWSAMWALITFTPGREPGCRSLPPLFLSFSPLWVWFSPPFFPRPPVTAASSPGLSASCLCRLVVFISSPSSRL